MTPRVTTSESVVELKQPISVLETVIPPEVIDDELAEWLTRLCASERLVNVLEIGSSSGERSTAAIVAGLSKNPNRPRLFCLEMVRSRYEALMRRFANDDFVVCYRASSVPPESFLSEAEVAKFFDEVDTDLKQYGLDTVLHWRAKQLAYVRENVEVTEGIDRIKSAFEIDRFDLVFMDGCEFTGEQDFKRVYGAKWILLDDINTLKSYAAWSSLKADPNYELVHENHALRHGFAVFRRRALEALQIELADAKAGAQPVCDLQSKFEAELAAAQADTKSLIEVRNGLEVELSAARQRMAEKADTITELTQRCDELNCVIDRQASEIVRLDLVIAGCRTKLAEVSRIEVARSDHLVERGSLQEQIGRLEKTIADMKLSPFWRGRERVVRLMRALRFRRRGMEQWEQR